MLYILFSPLKPSLSLCLRSEEDVVESNMVARTKSCYGQFEVWSTVSHPSVQMSLGGKESERERERGRERVLLYHHERLGGQN